MLSQCTGSVNIILYISIFFVQPAQHTKQKNIIPVALFEALSRYSSGREQKKRLRRHNKCRKSVFTFSKI